MTVEPAPVAVGDRVRTTITPWITRDGTRTALAGKVVAVAGDGATVAITAPAEWSGRDIEFTS